MANGIQYFTTAMLKESQLAAFTKLLHVTPSITTKFNGPRPYHWREVERPCAQQTLANRSHANTAPRCKGLWVAVTPNLIYVLVSGGISYSCLIRPWNSSLSVIFFSPEEAHCIQCPFLQRHQKEWKKNKPTFKYSFKNKNKACLEQELWH